MIKGKKSWRYSCFYCRKYWTFFKAIISFKGDRVYISQRVLRHQFYSIFPITSTLKSECSIVDRVLDSGVNLHSALETCLGITISLAHLTGLLWGWDVRMENNVGCFKSTLWEKVRYKLSKRKKTLTDCTYSNVCQRLPLHFLKEKHIYTWHI